jgi:hypothetical protein
LPIAYVAMLHRSSYASCEKDWMQGLRCLGNRQ